MHVGTPIIIADAQHVPQDVVHPAPVLSGLGHNVYMLTEAREGAQGMHWAALTYDRDPAAEGRDLSRIRNHKSFANDLRRQIHPGVIFVVADLPPHPDRR